MIEKRQKAEDAMGKESNENRYQVVKIISNQHPLIIHPFKK